jgi:hypothetical protein
MLDNPLGPFKVMEQVWTNPLQVVGQSHSL